MDNGIGRALARGALASVAGLVAMDLFSRSMKKVGGENGGGDTKKKKSGSKKANGAGRRLDDISLVGHPRKEGEPATETVGRLSYEKIMKREPSEQRRGQLGQAVHWGYGMAMGALFGVLERRMPGNDMGAGLGYGAALWLLGDELAVPLLGLSEGPTAHPPRVHAQALGAHLVYGLTTGAALRALERAM